MKDNPSLVSVLHTTPRKMCLRSPGPRIKEPKSFVPYRVYCESLKRPISVDDDHGLIRISYLWIKILINGLENDEFHTKGLVVVTVADPRTMLTS